MVKKRKLVQFTIMSVKTLSQADFETILAKVVNLLNLDISQSNRNHKPSNFEELVRTTLKMVLEADTGIHQADEIVQGFPDIVCGKFGVEVKATESDNWRSIANSVSEGKRATSVEKIYVVFGKMGGIPEVKWADYGASIIHVRTSHVPRFEIEIGSDRTLFGQLGISYEEFRTKPMDQKMIYIREYARSRLGDGERLWWLEDKDEDDQQHSLSLNVRLYMDLPQQEKRRLRAEAALLCPQVVGGSRQRRKYTDAVIYLITYRGVLCPQARDLFSAGSVAGKARGGHYVSRAFVDIQKEMTDAAIYLEEALFKEYWGMVPKRDAIIAEWLIRADKFATDWKPSEVLFLENS